MKIHACKAEGANRGAAGLSKVALAGMLLVAPIAGVGGCSGGRAAPASASVELSCEAGGGTEAEVELAGLKASVRGSCEGGEVGSVEVRMPCGSARFQERCSVTIPVPGEALFTRGSSKAPVEISAREEGGKAVVGLRKRI